VKDKVPTEPSSISDNNDIVNRRSLNGVGVNIDSDDEEYHEV
jgi:hypothetical protein